MTYSVSDLYIHPIKSLGAIQTSSFQIDACGPALDRRIMLIDPNGKFITQRQSPIMSLINVVLNNQTLTLSYGNESIKLPLPNFGSKTNAVTVDVWGDKISGQLISSNASQWLSTILKKDVRLVYMDDSEHRQVDLEFAKPGVQTGFSDGFPFLLISQASIDFLSDKVGFELLMTRFRPNIVVAGCEPFEEDSWKKIRIGQVDFDVVKPCSRCVIPTIDVRTGEKQKEVMQAMLEYRKKDKNVFVGQNLIHKQSGELTAGMTVEVLE